MKILIQNTIPTAARLVHEGQARAFQSAGHQVRFWNQQTESAFKVFREYEPDILLSKTFYLDRALYKCIATRPHLRVGMYTSDWGSLIEKIDLQKYPILVTQDQEMLLLEQLKKETGKPDFVYKHYTPKWIEPTLGGWRSIGIKPISLLNACDIFVYLGGTLRPELKCDVGLCSGYWSYKAKTLEPYIYPLIKDGLDVKIFGNQPWPGHVQSYLGFIEDQFVKDLFVSSTVCINIHEQHSQDYGFDIIERPFKVMGAGGFLVSDYVQGMTELFTSEECIIAISAEDFHEQITKFVKNPELRLPYMKNGQKKILSQHTYHHRVASIFYELNLPEEGNKVMEVYSRILESLYKNGTLQN